jgi:protein gp37
MAGTTSIEWTEASWNPVTGCTKVSEGCLHCYAERIAGRLSRMGMKTYQKGFSVTMHPDTLPIPRRWKTPRMIFVNSMSDLFHEEVPVEFIEETFSVMNEAYWHTFQILTKRPDRLLELAGSLSWSPNIWMGVTVELSKHLCRIDCLRKSPAAVKFISFEPLLGPITEVNLEGIDWVIVGGESGPGARPMSPSWACSLRDASISAGVPFFFKQWGGVNRKTAGRILDGQTWSQWPSGPISATP